MILYVIELELHGVVSYRSYDSFSWFLEELSRRKSTELRGYSTVDVEVLEVKDREQRKRDTFSQWYGVRV